VLATQPCGREADTLSLAIAPVHVHGTRIIVAPTVASTEDDEFDIATLPPPPSESENLFDRLKRMREIADILCQRRKI
jgi:hypothetical protein